jgi:hemerythrin-like domain-containing protein
MADSRDMVGAHDMFRAQFGALPDLVRSVGPGDAARAKVVGEHVELLATLLHGHHGAEDAHVWPALHERCPDQLQALVATMEAQHAGIDAGLRDLVTGARSWAAAGDQAGRDALAATAERLNPALADHLALEEAEMLRLIDTYLTEDEWKATVAAAAGKLTPEQGPLAIGMMLHEADDDMRGIIGAGVPEEFWRQVEPAAVTAYQSYAAQVYGDADAPRSR